MQRSSLVPRRPVGRPRGSTNKPKLSSAPREHPCDTALVILYGDPCSDLSPNSGEGRGGAVRARIGDRKRWKAMAETAFRVGGNGMIRETVLVFLDVYRPRVMDVQNIIAAMKAPMDGLVAGGAIPDDGPRWVAGFVVRQTTGKRFEGQRERVEVTLIRLSRLRPEWLASVFSDGLKKV